MDDWTGITDADRHLGRPVPLPSAVLPLVRWVEVHPAGDGAVEVEWNLDAPVDDEEMLRVQHKIAAFADSVTVVESVAAADGAAIVYDLAAPFGTARMVEFLGVEDGRVTEVRQIYDVTATDRYFPGLYRQ